jgi:glycosyltransferase involved in cell wall biosynthesis
MILKKEKPDCVQSFNPRMNHFIYLASLVYPMPPLFASVRNTNLSRKKRLFEFIFQNKLNKLIVNSISTKRELIRKAWVNEDKIYIIHNALDATYYFRYTDEKIKKLRDSNGIDSDTFLILSIGRIHKQKNILCTLKALARLKKREKGKKIRLCHIGYKQDKGMYMKILSFIAENDMEGICYFMEPVHDIVHFYNMADVMVLSSLWEGLPNVVLEAMSCESIVVVAESADNDRIVDHGVTGFKFKKNDDGDLACILERIMGVGVKEKRRIGKKARLEVMRRFSTDKMVREFQALYKAV